MSSVKSRAFTAINPNGRIPAIHDPNTGLTLWESGAIVSYLAATYDAQHAVSYPAMSAEHWRCEQWVAFQISGQGPYWGQWVWFEKYHPEKVDSARLRYLEEVRRVMGVLDGWLEEQGTQDGAGAGAGEAWLVGNKCTYADLSFLPWALKIAEVDGDGKVGVEKYVHYSAWLERMKQRPGVEKVLKERIDEMAKQPW